MRDHLIERTQIIRQPLARTFAFFSDAFNLELITPPFLHFRILTPPPIKMGVGAWLDYRLTLFGLPFGWRTLIESWRPEESFIDTQIQGPYALWRHTHTFEARGTAQTLMRDHVEYRIPLGPLGRLARALFVAETLEKIFDYRAELTARLLAPMEDARIVAEKRNDHGAQTHQAREASHEQPRTAPGQSTRDGASLWRT